MRACRPIAGFAFASLVAGSAACSLAQTAAAPAPTPASDQSTVLKANANLVLIDVVVTDRGSPVHGLDRGRFHVLEDGHEQPIATFDEHRPATTQLSGVASRAALPPRTYTNVPAYPAASAVNVLLLDALNTPMATQMNVRRQMIEYLAKIAPGTPLAIFTLSSRLRLIEGFTTDPAQLAKALQGGNGTPQQSVILDPQSDQALDTGAGDMAAIAAASGAPTAAGISAVSSMQQFEADVTAFQTDLRVQMTLDAMQQLARYLSGIPGRKNVVWFSGSFPIVLDPDSALQDPFQAMRNYSDQIRDTAELLSASRVAVYPVDARGLMPLPSMQASYTPSSNLMGATSSGNRSGSRRRATANRPSTSNDDLNATKQRMAEQASMEQIAEQTGGQEYINTNGMKEAVASAVENGSSYYTIGYVPAARPLDGQFRKIHVNLDNHILDNRDLKLAYRHGYYADPADQASAHTPGQTSLIAAATMHGAPPATQILFEARLLPATDPLLKGTNPPAGPGGELTASLKAPPHRIIADLKIDPHGLLFDTAPDGASHSRVEFMLVAYDAVGQRVNYVDRGLQVTLKAGQLQQSMATGIRIRLPIDLPAGQFSLRIAVNDLGAGRAGSLEVPLVVAAN